ncbi:MAG TPA: gamma carbonic anhydrase family protein [Ruminiclostridium sp.]|jgi:carbonic anhydrase/acetyltransferase-like protein (isoleucine patch superfamily)|nr:gamma carbonic anhydrase family protein [Ruminiclostridium sp.]
MIRSFKDQTPKIHEKAYIAESAQIIGDVVLEKNVSIWDNAVLRGDLGKIIVGENSNIQDVSSVHNTEGIPVIIGKNVTVGHRAILHSCTIGDNTLVGMGAIILDNAAIGKNCIIGAGAVVTGNTVVPDGSMVLGIPAKVVKSLSEAQIESSIKNAEEYVQLAASYKEENF